MAYPHSQMNSKPLWRTSFILNTCKPQDKVNDVFNCAQNKYVEMSLKILVMHSAMRYLQFFFLMSTPYRNYTRITRRRCSRRRKTLLIRLLFPVHKTFSCVMLFKNGFLQFKLRLKPQKPVYSKAHSHVRNHQFVAIQFRLEA